MALQNIRDTLKIFFKKNLINASPVFIKPMETYTDTLPAFEAKTDLTAVLGNRELVYNDRSFQKTLERPLETPANNNGGNALSQLYQRAQNQFKSRAYTSALQTYQKCLNLDDTFSPARIRLAELYYRRTEYRKAVSQAKKLFLIILMIQMPITYMGSQI